MSVVEKGSIVTVHYEGKLSSGDIFDDSRRRGEGGWTFEVGSNSVIPGFSDNLLGKAAGETVTFNLQPEDAYGQPTPEAIQAVPKTNFPEGFEWHVGRTLQMQNEQGPIFAKVVQELEDTVVLDLNHPLAGQVLTFSVELIKVEETGTELPVK